MLPRLTMMRTFAWLVAAIPAISALAPAAAGADEPDKSFALTNASDSGLVVLGFEGARTWTIYLIGYDPKTNRALRNQGGEFEGFWPLFPEEVKLRYRFLEARPGYYAISALHANRYYGCLRPTTLAFEVKPGQVTYIGNLAMDTVSGARRLPDDLAGAQVALTAYPNVTAPLVLAARSEVNPEADFRFACTNGGAYRYVER